MFKHPFSYTSISVASTTYLSVYTNKRSHSFNTILSYGIYTLFLRFTSTTIECLEISSFTSFFDFRILFYKPRTDNTSRNSHHTYAEKSNKNAKYFSQYGDWINIAISYLSNVDAAHQMPENALEKTSGCASCSKLYIHKLDAIISIRMMNTEEISCCFLDFKTSEMTLSES